MQGFRIIDLTREVFDVVVMNPPFGALAANKDDLVKAYPQQERPAVDLCRAWPGADARRRATRRDHSRTCFFLSSFQKWREDVVLGIARPEVMADLGFGVMDDALVEFAAYVLEKQT